MQSGSVGRLESNPPRSSAAALVIVMIWFVTICVVAWMLWSLMMANSNVAPKQSPQ